MCEQSVEPANHTGIAIPTLHGAPSSAQSKTLAADARVAMTHSVRWAQVVDALRLAWVRTDQENTNTNPSAEGFSNAIISTHSLSHSLPPLPLKSGVICVEVSWVAGRLVHVSYETTALESFRLTIRPSLQQKHLWGSNLGSNLVYRWTGWPLTYIVHVCVINFDAYCLQVLEAARSMRTEWNAAAPTADGSELRLRLNTIIQIMIVA